MTSTCTFRRSSSSLCWHNCATCSRQTSQPRWRRKTSNVTRAPGSAVLRATGPASTLSSVKSAALSATSSTAFLLRSGYLSTNRDAQCIPAPFRRPDTAPPLPCGWGRPRWTRRALHLSSNQRGCLRVQQPRQVSALGSHDLSGQRTWVARAPEDLLHGL